MKVATIEADTLQKHIHQLGDALSKLESQMSRSPSLARMYETILGDAFIAKNALQQAVKSAHEDAPVFIVVIDTKSPNVEFVEIEQNGKSISVPSRSPEDSRYREIGPLYLPSPPPIHGESLPKQIEKPSWDDAPEWAEWLAKNMDGAWYWYRKRPVDIVWTWCGTNKSERANTDYIPEQWRETLESRPGTEAEGSAQ